MAFKKGDKPKGKASEIKSPEELKLVPVSPVHKSFYIEKTNGTWKLVIADVQDDKIISRKIKDCDNKAVALETFKIEFAMLYFFGK